MRINKFLSRHIFGIIQVGIWLLLFTFPILFILLDYGSALELFLSWLVPIGIIMLMFYLNYWLMVPRLLFRHRKAWYFIANAALILIPYITYEMFMWPASTASTQQFVLETLLHIVTIILGFSPFVFMAVALRSMQRNIKIEREQARQKEELARMKTEWLKAQLNPHFIFNTLNNISALIDIDVEKTREAIGRLSHLMRYVLEQEGTQLVSLESEINFLHDYILLMQLRYTSSLKVTADLPEADITAGMMVPPMLFITPVENAFKHGASSSKPTFIDICMSIGTDGRLTLRVVNSLLPPSQRQHHLNHGVGLTNLSRRLKILYHDNHSFRHTSHEARCTYETEITIPLINTSEQ